jgi:hypothetical protein
MAEQKAVEVENGNDEVVAPNGAISPRAKNSWHLNALLKVKEWKDQLQKESWTFGPAFVRDATKCDALSKLSRCGTSIERSLYRALHELQRLQAPRAGVNVPPPVAVDVEARIAASVEKVGLAEGDETNFAQRTQILPEQPPESLDLD